jgi:serine/threonine protein kinase
MSFEFKDGHFGNNTADFKVISREVLRKIFRSRTSRGTRFKPERIEKEIEMTKELSKFAIFPGYCGDGYLLEGTFGKRRFVDIQLIEGNSLIRSNGSNIKDAVFYCMLQQDYAPFFHFLAKGLQELHEEGWIHRDISLFNVMAGLDGMPYLVDANLVRKISHCDEGVLVSGNPSFMSPEQCRGETLDERSDIYNLGMTMYIYLSGKFPFTGNAYSVIEQQVEDMPNHLTNLRPDLDSRLCGVVMHCVQKDKEDRYQKMEYLAKDLGLLAA